MLRTVVSEGQTVPRRRSARARACGAVGRAARGGRDGEQGWGHPVSRLGRRHRASSPWGYLSSVLISAREPCGSEEEEEEEEVQPTAPTG